MSYRHSGTSGVRPKLRRHRMEMVTNETALDVLSRAACMLEYTGNSEAEVEQGIEVADKSPSAVKRSFDDLDLEVDDRVPPPCLPPSIHYHPCRPRPVNSNSPPSSTENGRSQQAVVPAGVGCSSKSANKCPRLDGECCSPRGASGSSRYTSVAEADTTRKCAATQTFFSSFTYPPPDDAVVQRLLPPPYPSEHTGNSSVIDRDEFSSRLVLDRDQFVGRRPSSSSSAISSSFQTSWSTMAIPDDEDDATNVPLNLTKRPTVSGGRAVCWQNPDDITSTRNACVTSSASFWQPESMQSSSSLPPWVSRGSSTSDTDCRGLAGGSGLQRSEGRRPESSPCLRREQRQPFSSVTHIDGCDREIEEHFQRSLGRDYPRFLSNTAQLSASSTLTVASLPSTTLPSSMSLIGSVGNDVTQQSFRSLSSFFDSPCDVIDRPLVDKNSATNVSVAGTVDDHFAKSLGGATWNRIKETIDVTHEALGSGCGQDLRLASTPSLTPGSVDDHFAKALGDAWFKIKADSERV